MKVVFLDVDGVLNSDVFLGAVDRSRETDWKDYWINSLDTKLVEILNRIIDETGAVVVMSSSWRVAMKIADARGILGAANFRGELVGYTPYLIGMNRGTEIAQWLSAHDVEKFIIIDDVDDMGELSCRLVKTDHGLGITMEQADKAIELLKS